jgi:signal recognition particle subunit SRP19
MGKKAHAVRIKQVGPKGMPAQLPTMEDFAIPAEEMIHLPPPPNRKYQVFWPIHETFTLKIKGFQVIYPSYLDSNKTVKQGRRMAQDLALPAPTCYDISQALQQLQVRHVLQPYKGYSRDITCLWDNPGRVLVDVSLFKKSQLMRQVAARIPTLADRISRLEREAIEAAVEDQKMLEARAKQVAQQTSKKTAGVTGNKKKGKRGKKTNK